MSHFAHQLGVDSNVFSHFVHPYYWKQFDIYAIKRTLEEHRDCIIDFGAGQTVFENKDKLAQVEKLIESYPNVIPLLPSQDPDESVVVLRDRLRQRTSINGIPLILYLITHHSNYALETARIYTDGKTPTGSKKEIIKVLSGK